jgi:hypothetical protein
MGDATPAVYVLAKEIVLPIGLAIVKIICDGIRPSAAFGYVLEG